MYGSSRAVKIWTRFESGHFNGPVIGKIMHAATCMCTNSTFRPRSGGKYTIMHMYSIPGRVG